MTKYVLYFFLVSVTLLTSSMAHAFCREPSFYSSAPSAPKSYSKPDVPYCMNSISGEGCNQWEIDNYIDEVNQYIEDLQKYANESATFANEAIEFANDAQKYAECEVSDVKAQHE